jgi:hypothetical protein
MDAVPRVGETVYLEPDTTQNYPFIVRTVVWHPDEVEAPTDMHAVYIVLS